MFKRSSPNSQHDTTPPQYCRILSSWPLGLLVKRTLSLVLLHLRAVCCCIAIGCIASPTPCWRVVLWVALLLHASRSISRCTVRRLNPPEPLPVVHAALDVMPPRLATRSPSAAAPHRRPGPGRSPATTAMLPLLVSPAKGRAKLSRVVVVSPRLRAFAATSPSRWSRPCWPHRPRGAQRTPPLW